jgi:hypothetical protein
VTFHPLKLEALTLMEKAMEQVPHWLSAAVAAAGMTAYADDLYPKASKVAASTTDAAALEEPIAPLH